MTALVLGPNGSGKSAYAEGLIERLSHGVRYYIATMIPYGEEGAARVEKHRKQREGMDFFTVERPVAVSGIPLPEHAAVLLEDVSNLLGNTLFGGGDEAAVFQDITALCQSCETAVLVSIDGLTESPAYDGETRAYIAALNRLNQRLADFADTVVQMSGGQPVLQKGDAYALD